MELGSARFCLDCEEIFEGAKRCPKCGSEVWHPIMSWIRPMSEAERRTVVKLRDVSAKQFKRSELQCINL
jgi:hypothetical protein